MNIENDIKEAIAKNLPQAVGAALQQRLEQADKDAARVKSLQSEVETIRAENVSINNQLAEATARLAAHAALDKREAEIAERERNAKVAELEVRLAAAGENTKFAREVALGLVRNVEYRNTVHETTQNKSHPVTGANGTCGMVMNSYQPENTTTTTANQAI